MKSKKTQTAPLIILAVVFIIIVIFEAANFFVGKNVVSATFTDLENLLELTPYSVKILDEEHKYDGIVRDSSLIVQLDQKYTFKYECRYSIIPDDSGNKPSCSYYSVDDSFTSYGCLGESILRNNYSEYNRLITKYQEALSAEDEFGHSIVANDQDVIEDFFYDLMEINDFKKAYNAYLSIKSQKNRNSFSSCLDYLRLNNVAVDNKDYRGIDLFDWANRKGIKLD